MCVFVCTLCVCGQSELSVMTGWRLVSCWHVVMFSLLLYLIPCEIAASLGLTSCSSADDLGGGGVGSERKRTKRVRRNRLGGGGEGYLCSVRPLLN